MNQNSREVLRDWAKAHAADFSGTIIFDEPLSKHTYYRIGGPAPVLVAPKSPEDLQWIRECLRATGAPHFVLGAGSNLLVSDDGFPGLIVKAGRMNGEIALLAKDRLRTGGSVAVSTLLRRAAQEGWLGLELLAGVPGLIGGVVTMNAGTHLGEAKDRLVRIEYFTLGVDSSALASPAQSDPARSTDAEALNPRAYSESDFKFEYRRNLFLPAGGLVWAAEWRIEKGDPREAKARLDDLLFRRKSTQPVEYPSCGSVFKNPRAHGMSAWQVLDRLRLRGESRGGAQIAEKHSNFIVNRGKATAADVLALIQLAQSRAQAELGIPLETEVIFLGF